jgi:hypothetical protein
MFISWGMVSFPMPMPIVRLAESEEGAYPCQGGHCGCSSAHQCWTSCCCMTLEQRLQWAKSRGIEPPDYVKKAPVAQASGGGSNAGNSLSVSRPTTSCCDGGCCSKKIRSAEARAAELRDAEVRGAEVERRVQKTPTCCGEKSSPDKVAVESQNPSRKWGLMISITALQCQGIQMYLAIQAGFLPLTKDITIQAIPGLTWMVRQVDTFHSLIMSPPPTPPPRSFG